MLLVRTFPKLVTALGLAGGTMTLAAPTPAQLPPDPAHPGPEVAEAATLDDAVAADADEPELEFGAVAEIDAPPRETTRHVVEREQLTRIPGTSGDAVRAVEVMPGVARTSISWGVPILRGAAWHESASFVDGVPVPLLYHLGGVKSTFNSHLLERVEFYPGNFSARFGRVTGGVVDVRVRDPRSDRFHGLLDLSVLDSSVVVETPVTPETAVALGARRSNLDFFFESFIPEDEAGQATVIAAPLYWDYQAIGTHALAPGHRLRLVGYGSRDSIRLLMSNPDAVDPALRGSIEAAMEHHRVQAALESELSREVEQQVQLTYGRSRASQRIGPVIARFDQNEVYGRGEWRILASPVLRANFGFDVEALFLVGEYRGSRPPQAEGDPGASGALAAEEAYDATADDDTISMVRPAGYVELEVRPHPRLLLVPGIRFDYYGYVGEASVDPRLSARYEAGLGSTLKWGTGVYSQPPQYYEVIPGFGNPDLEPYHALHTSVGLEQALLDGLEIGVETFYKRLIHRVVATPGGAPPTFENDGVGRIYGAELSAELRTEATFGYLAYTLMRSERRDRNDTWRLFDQDQSHILSVVASHDLGRGWEVGGRFRLVSGNPTTPVVAAVYDAGLDVYRPVYGPTNSERAPLFHQLDLRGEKRFAIGQGYLAVYLDLQNAYNATHVEAYSYSFDYSERRDVTGLPIIPNLGLRGEL